jgi:hypothetical protein
MESDTLGIHSWNKVWSAFTFFFDTPTDWEGYDILDAASRARLDMSSAKLVLQAIISYVLPFFYGLLGALVWVIRRVSSEIEAHRFLAQSRHQHITRIALGPLAGIIIGLLISTDLATSVSAISVLKTLSPIGLAFIAGYSIELLYSFLDRIVDSFIGRDPRDGMVSIHAIDEKK